KLIEAPIPKPEAARCLLSCGESPSSLASSFRDKPELKSDRVADKKFWLVNGAAVGAAILQTSAVAHCRHTVGRENCSDRYGPFIAMQSVSVGFVTGMSVVSYFWKKSEQESGAKHGSWWIVPAGLVAFNGYWAAQQYRKHCPKGTVFNGDGCE